MPSYTCEKCARVFKQKSGYTDHLAKKTDCANTTAINQVIDAKVGEIAKEVKEVKQALIQAKGEINKDNLPAFFDDLHNLLWNKAGLNPERALEHMTFFFAYRLIEQQADALGLPQECRWSYIASLKDENDLFETVDKGIDGFWKNLKTKPFFKPHEIKKAEIVYEIVQQINRIPLSIIQETDTLGDIFEYMLGRGMSTMADEGQYFTNRAICKLAFKLAYEIKQTLRRPDGSLCTFADWFCGTGGFPAAYVKGVNEKVADIDWQKDAASIYCQDMNLSSVTTTLLNMLILTGIPFSDGQLRGSNSFADDIIVGENATFKNLTVDYCFMNPPYGGDKSKAKEYKFAYTKGKGKDKKFCVNKDIQSIGIEDDDKVSAGVQLAMATLSANGGIGCVVLPQGFFFGASKKCVELRKKLAEEYKIWFIVDIASGSFLNTGTKTSMMVFQKGAGPTETVKFIGLDEKLLVEATLDELKAKHYSLNYKQYLPQSAVELDGFEMVKLGELVNLSGGKFTTGYSKENPGIYPFFSGKTQQPDGSCKAYCFDGDEYLVMIKDGGSGAGNYSDSIGLGKVFYVKGKSAGTSHNVALHKKNDKIIMMYLYYYLKTIKPKIMDLAKYTTGLGVIGQGDLRDIDVPIPSIEVQQQIVEAIDGWTTLAQHEEDALKILEKQMMFYVKAMGRGQPRVKLGDIASFTFGYGIKSEDFGETGLPIIKTKNFKDESVSIISSNPRSNKKYDDKYLIKKGDLLMVVDGACGESAVWAESENGWLNQHVAKLSIDNETTRMYVAFVMKGDIFKEYIQSNVVITTIPHMQRDVAKNFEIPLPPLALQETLQSDFDEICHKHAKIAIYKAKAQEAIQRLIPGAAPAQPAQNEPTIIPNVPVEPMLVEHVTTAPKKKLVIKKIKPTPNPE
jgi:type I restriction enzyme S subunit